MLPTAGAPSSSSSHHPHLAQLQRALTEDGDKLTSKEIDSLMNVLLSKKRSLEHTRRKESLDLLQHFLATAKSKREEQLRRLQTELQVVSKDLKSVEGELRRLKSRDNDDDIDEPTVSWADDEAGLGANDSIVSGDDDEKEDLSVPAVGADHPDLKRKRKRQVGGLPNTAPERGATLRAAAHVPSDVAEGPTQQSRSPRITESVKRLEPHQADLEDGYFSLRIRDSAGQQLGTHAELESFGSELSKISSKARFRTVANLHYADSLSGSQNSIVSAIVFDKDDEFFATAGVTKKIKVFEFASLTQGDPKEDRTDGRHVPRIKSTLRRMSVNAPEEREEVPEEAEDFADHLPSYPVKEVTCRSKISSLSWNSHIKSHLASADYEGCVTLWDTNVGVQITQFEEHEKRAWSVDFSKTDPTTLASGGDDAKVKIWSTSIKNSVCTIEGRANVCSVKFNPDMPYHLAFGSADHSVHLYDIRSISSPLHVFRGHRKAVSYVQFRNHNEMVTASTDGTLKLWDISASIREQKSAVVRTFTGHANERNFVGLSISSDSDLVACGSETNAVYVYHHKIQNPLLLYRFGPAMNALTADPASEDDTSQFVSSVCWTRRLPGYLVCANSLGRMKVLQLIE